ncbi:Uncharacterised protein [Leclercia adecarboxylata]|uniref:Uncharacterized protein n=1 Tax=Leclercia adecarboxylata TaxID=83655 RepID=A0A4U9I009_9ENTR|nr:Uncharacterised protein [Leclercia adecarboxylata]
MRAWGEIRQPARMIEIQVRQNNVTDVSHAKTQRLDPGACRERLAALDVIQHPEKARQPGWLAHVAQSEAGIHQHQPVAIGFNQQAVADQVRMQPLAKTVVKCAAQRAHTPAVKVMNLHIASSST